MELMYFGVMHPNLTINILRDFPTGKMPNFFFGGGGVMGEQYNIIYLQSIIIKTYLSIQQAETGGGGDRFQRESPDFREVADRPEEGRRHQETHKNLLFSL